MNNLSLKEAAIKELQKRGVSYEDNSSESNSFNTSSLKKAAIKELQRRSSLSQSSYTNDAVVLGKGLVSGLGGGAIDTASLLYNVPAGIHNFQRETEREKESLSPEKRNRLEQIPTIPNPLELASKAVFSGDAPYIPSAQEAIEKGIDKLSGGYTKTPANLKHIYEGAKFSGALGGIGGLGKLAGKLGSKGFEKVGKTLGATGGSELGGSAAVGTTISYLEDESPLLSLPTAIVAGALTTKSLGGLPKLGEAIKGTVTGKGTSLGDITLGRALAIKGEPYLPVIQAAKEYGIDLPFNVPLNSPVANFLANTALNTIYTAKEYNNIIEKAPKQLKDKFIDIIDRIHPENVGKTQASGEYYTALKNQEKIIDDQSNKLYGYARELLKKEDKVVPSNTIKALKDLKSDLSAPVPSSPMKFVIDRLGKLSKAWDLIPPSLDISKEFAEDAPHLYEKLANSLIEKAKPVSVDSLIQQRSAFMQDLRSQDTKGMQRQLGRIIKGLDEDISSLKNKEFLDHWKAANSFYKNEVAGKIRSDFSRSMMEGVFPKQAYDYMTSPSKIDELYRILGSSPEIDKIMASLKRAKLQNILIDPSLNAEGGMNMATFANKFNKNSQDRELLKSLLGEKSFNDLKKLSQMAQSFSSAGKSFANPSGTTVRNLDMARGGSLIGGLLSGNSLMIAGGGTSIATPWILSKLLSNPRYTNAAVKYATAAKNKQLIKASSYEKIMNNIFSDMIKKNTPQIINEEIQ